MMRYRLMCWLVLALGAVALVGGCEQDRSYPSQPINLICPWAAGGGTDRVARQVAVQLEQELGVPVNVINATGGEGVTGHTRGALASPDGYTVLLATAELNMLHWREMTSIGPGDVDPLMLINRDSAAIFVRDDSPWESLGDLQEAIRERPGEIAASGTAYGGIWHIAVAGWLNHVGGSPGDVNWISIAGATPSLQELIARGVDFVSCSLPEARSLMASGEVRALGVMAEDRVPGFEDVPTFAEQGVDWQMGTWRALVVPPGVPEERFEVLAEAVGNVVTSERFETFMADAGFTIERLGPEEAAASLASMDEQFGEVLTSEAFRDVQAQQFGPRLFPTLLIALLVLVLGGWGWQWYRGGPAFGGGDAAGWNFAMVGVIGVIAAYLVVVDWVGFVVAGSAAFVALMWMLGVRSLLALPAGVVFVAGLYHVFAVLLRVPLPRGLLGW